jgi:hypothetical protein
LLSFLVGLGALVGMAETAAAIEVQCIEESRYKHLYQLFGGDTRKFAAYLKVDTGRLPDPEACRAALIAGPIGAPNDREKLLDFVVRNKGWLAAVHLNSGGGSVWTGQQLGYIVRAFRLKTITARNAGNKLLYEPDFALAPLPAESPAAAVPMADVAAPGQSQPPRCLLHEHVPTALMAKGAVSGISRPDNGKPPSPPSIGTFEENTGRGGADYRDFDLAKADPRLCQKSCVDEARCRAWTYRKPEGRRNGKPHCWLKERVPQATGDKLNVAGVVPRLQYLEPTYEENFDRPGSDFRDFDVATADPKLCQKSCVDEARCRAWTYRKPEGRRNGKPHCWLKEHVPTQVNRDGMTVAGMVIHLGTFEPTYEMGVERPGQEYRHVDLALPEPRACPKACADDGKCRAWGYQEPNSAFLVAFAAGWDAYRARQRSILSKASPGTDFCASSCVQIHVAGLDRSGIMQVHRPNQGFGHMSATSEDLTTNDAHMPQFYKHMDAGPRVTQLMQATSATIVNDAFASRFPRYILDYLIVHCGTDPEQLEGLEKQLETTIKELSPAGAAVSIKLNRLHGALAKVHERRRRVEQCVAQAMEQDRLEAYDKLCGKSCDQKKLGADFDAAVRKIREQTR